MNNPKNKPCLDRVEVGDILFITCDHTFAMIYDNAVVPITNVGMYPVLEIKCPENRYFFVRSRCKTVFNPDEPVIASGTLVRIKRKKR